MSNTEENQEIDNIDPVLEKAMSRGWRPQDEWEGNPGEWVEAEEFNRRGELMDTISQLNKRDKSKDERIDRLELALKELGEHNRKIAEKEYDRALKTLKSQKVQALEMDDHEGLLEVEDKIEQVKEAKRKFNEEESKVQTPKAESAEVNPIVEEWKENNKWYATNVAMRGAADAFAADFISRNPSMANSAESVLKYVSEQMSKEFPSIGERRRPSATVDTNGSTNSSRNKSRFTAKDLNETQRRVGETLVKAGSFSKIQEYVDQLAELGEL